MIRDERKALLCELALEYGWVCWYCNLPLHYKAVEHHYLGSRVESKDVIIHIDHIIPRSAGGTDDFKNLALACEFCNRAKLDMNVETYLTWLDRVRYAETWTPIRDGRRDPQFNTPHSADSQSETDS